MIKVKEYINLFFNKLEFVKLTDALSIILFLIALPISLIYKQFRKDLWLVCERNIEARDNGYVFFKYLRFEHPEQDVVYAISSRSSDYDKVASIGKVVEFGSLSHWILYLTAKWNLSSQKDGKPNGPLGYFLEVFGLRKSRMIYLRHGVTISDQRWVYFPVSKFRVFVCGAYPEYLYVKKNFRYPEENVKYLGLCRFDDLHNTEINNKQILVIPTWREWISFKTKEARKIDNAKTFTKTEYFLEWNKLLNNLELSKLLKNGGYQLIFYLHSNFQKYINEFSSSSKNIIIAKQNEYDIQDLLKVSSLMITDYSSVFIDFAYMKKPVIYYQFDYEKYRKGHYQEGYFSYKNHGFGPVCENIQQVLYELKVVIDNGMNLSNLYQERLNNFFMLYDNNNCKRTYEMIKNLKL